MTRDETHEPSAWRVWFSNQLQLLRPSPNTTMLGMALLIGVGAGLGAIGFSWLIDAVKHIAFNGGGALLAFLGRYYVIIIPALGGLIVGPLVYYFAREAKGHGVPEVMEAVALRGGRIRPIVVVIKSLASSICIGTGGAVGREGPIVQIGSALGSSLGQWLGISGDRLRNLVACGAAGGIAATFNAPIAGVIFALEVILGDFSVTSFSTVVIASVTASEIARVVHGNTPAFEVAPYRLVSAWELPMYAVLGVVAAVVGVIFVKVLYKSEDLFDAWRFPEPLKPVIGGFLIGGIGILLSADLWRRLRHHRTRPAQHLAPTDHGAAGGDQTGGDLAHHWLGRLGRGVRPVAVSRRHVGRQLRHRGQRPVANAHRPVRRLRPGRHGGSVRRRRPRTDLSRAHLV